MPNARPTPTIRNPSLFVAPRGSCGGRLAALTLSALAGLGCARGPGTAPPTPSAAIDPVLEEAAKRPQPASYDVRYATRGMYDVRVIVSGLDRVEEGYEGDTALDLIARVTTRPAPGGDGDRLPGRAMQIDWEVTEIHSQVVVGLRDAEAAVGARGIVVLDASGAVDEAATGRARADAGLGDGEDDEGQGVERDILARALLGAFAWPALPQGPLREGAASTAKMSRPLELDGVPMQFDGSMTYALAEDEAGERATATQDAASGGEASGSTVTVELAGVGEARPRDSERDVRLAMKSEGSVTLTVPQGQPRRIDVFEETQVVVDGVEMVSRWRVISTFSPVGDGAGEARLSE